MFCSIEYDIGTSNQFYSGIKKNFATNFTLFIKNFVVSGSCLHEFDVCYGCVFQKRNFVWFQEKESKSINKKMERWPRDPPKIGLKIIFKKNYYFFLWYFLLFARKFFLYIRHLNEECFESAVPTIFLSYAPTFFIILKTVISKWIWPLHWVWYG